jgi:hypothetical protein
MQPVEMVLTQLVARGTLRCVQPVHSASSNQMPAAAPAASNLSRVVCRHEQQRCAVQQA